MSLDDGETWETVVFSDSLVHPQVFLFPERTATTTFVYLLAGNYSLVTIDLKNLFPRKCEAADLEDWGGYKGQCIFGEKRKLKRRIAQRKCLIDKPLEAVSQEICECARLDFEW